MDKKSRFFTQNRGILLVTLLAGLFLFQGQTFYGKRQTGFYKTKEDGAAFGYYIPRSIDQKTKRPLVVVFGIKATDVMKWKDVAEKDGLVIVAIQAKYGGIWNWNWDVDRALSKVREVKNWYPIDETKVWATGYENGGSFALLMTLNHPEVFNAVSIADARVAGMEILQGDSGTKADPFSFTTEVKRHRPIQVWNFTKSETVTAEEAANTRALFEKFGYAVSYESIEGESYAPTQKMVQGIYDWFQNQK